MSSSRSRSVVVQSTSHRTNKKGQSKLFFPQEVVAEKVETETLPLIPGVLY